MKSTIKILSLMLLILILTACNNSSGDSKIYKELTSDMLQTIKNKDIEGKFNPTRLEEYQLDKNDLNDYPLAIFEVEKDYAIVFESPNKEKHYIAYEKDSENFYFNTHEESVKETIKDSSPIYSQNNFK